MASPRKIDGLTIVALLSMYALLGGNLLLYATAPLTIGLHILVSAIAIHLAFTIWHEAMHGTVSRTGWINDLVGIVGMFPYMTPYYMQKWVHLQHHAKLNEPEDPNRIYLDGSFWTVPLRYPRALRYARKVLAGDPRTRREQTTDALFLATVLGVYAVAWWNGVLVDVVLLWLVPALIAKLVMDWYINYLPHIGLPAHRFWGTRIVDVPWLTPLVLSHNYHAVHHLWPTVPWHRYRSIFKQKRSYLREHGVPIETSLLGLRLHPTELAQPDSRTG